MDNKTPIDIKTLIQTSNIEIYDKTKLIDKLKENFSEQDQKLYVCNLFLFLNYHPINDYVINLDNVWKFIGFSNKANAKRLLKHNFKENIDYKIVFIRSDENKVLLIRTDERKNEETRGRKQETIMLNINTFKKLCLKANTDNADKIHDYYIKLEMIYNELMKEELDLQKNLIKQKEKAELKYKEQLQHTSKQIQEKQLELSKKDNIITILKNKPKTHGYLLRKHGFVYICSDKSKPGHYKIGMAIDILKRLRNLNTSSSQKSLFMVFEIESYDCELLEKTLHSILQPFNIPGRREWFYFTPIELQYALHTIKKTNAYLNNFDFKSYNDVLNYMTNNNVYIPNDDLSYSSNEITEITNNNPQNVDVDVDVDVDVNSIEKGTEEILESDLEEPEEIESEQESIKETNIFKLSRQLAPNTGNYKGISWCKEKNKWKAELKKDYLTYFCGYFDSELEAAKKYNDYASYLNKQSNTNYILNVIPGYIPQPVNVPEDNKQKINEKKTSQYNGVSYSTKRKHYQVSIKYKGKSYHLGKGDELECAKIYNQQALYFNNTFNTNYELNNIPNYITLPKNIHDDIQKNKTLKKSSIYHGVSYIKRLEKYRAFIVHNKKQIHLGVFTTDLEAAQVYNKKATELNNDPNMVLKYKINALQN